MSQAGPNYWAHWEYTFEDWQAFKDSGYYFQESQDITDIQKQNAVENLAITLIPEEHVSELYLAAKGIYLDAELTKPYRKSLVLDQALYTEHLSVDVRIYDQILFVDVMGNGHKWGSSENNWYEVLYMPIPAGHENEAEQIAAKYNELYPSIEPSYMEDFYYDAGRAEHTFRFLKQDLLWEKARLRTPAQFELWSNIVGFVLNELVLAQPLNQAYRRAWENAARQARPQQVRRGMAIIIALQG